MDRAIAMSSIYYTWSKFWDLTVINYDGHLSLYDWPQDYTISIQSSGHITRFLKHYEWSWSSTIISPIHIVLCSNISNVVHREPFDTRQGHHNVFNILYYNLGAIFLMCHKISPTLRVMMMFYNSFIQLCSHIWNVAHHKPFVTGQGHQWIVGSTVSVT